MRRPRAIPSAIILVLILAILAFVREWFLSQYPAICIMTPKVYHVAGASPSAATWNVLFLGAGFQTDDQLETYRRAVMELSMGMLRDPTLCRHRKSISFLRIDVRASEKVQTTLCSDPNSCSFSEWPPPAPGGPPITTGVVIANPTGQDVVDVDLGAELCWNSPSVCRVLWLDDQGRDEALELALCAPDIDAVVVLANLKQAWGGGRAGVWEPSPGTYISLATAGLPENFEASRRLVSHELGHALGLLDEYVLSSGYAPSIVDDRNIFNPGDRCWKPGGAAKTAIPWQADLPCMNWSSPCDCGGASPCLRPWLPGDDATDPHPCCVATKSTPASWSPTDPLIDCATNTADPCDGAYQAPPERCLDRVGAFQGAFYDKWNYYRAQYQCLMKETGFSEPIEFCVACRRVIDKTLAPFGVPKPCRPNIPRPKVSIHH